MTKQSDHNAPDNASDDAAEQRGTRAQCDTQAEGQRDEKNDQRGGQISAGHKRIKLHIKCVNGEYRRIVFRLINSDGNFLGQSKLITWAIKIPSD
jgi:hypothetical protein